MNKKINTEDLDEKFDNLLKSDNKNKFLMQNFKISDIIKYNIKFKQFQ